MNNTSEFPGFNDGPAAFIREKQPGNFFFMVLAELCKAFDIQFCSIHILEIVIFEWGVKPDSATMLIDAHRDFSIHYFTAPDSVDGPREKKFSQIVKDIFTSTGINESFWKPLSSQKLSPYFQNQVSMLQKIASSNAPVVITGETGTGKDFIAGWLYSFGMLPGSLTTINLAAIPEPLFESELFGYSEGAFSDAGQGSKGKIALAHGGVLVLDGLENLSLSSQAKLLRVLQDGSYYPLGSTTLEYVTCRFIALSQKKLDQLVVVGKFREDLYYRLNVLPVYLPRLQDRPQDIPFFVGLFCLEHNLESSLILQLTKECCNRNFPGNIRELLNYLESRVLLSEHSSFDENINSPVQHSQKSLKEAIMLYKKGYIHDILRECNGNQTKAARVLGIERTYLARLIKELVI